MFDTEVLNAAGWKAAGNLHGLEMTDELLRAHIGTNKETTKRLMQNHFGPTFDFEAVRSDRIAHCLRHIEENGTPLKPGLRELLAYLDEKGLKTAIASSTDERFVRFHLEHAALGHEFDAIICGDKVKESKPEPDIFLTALAELDVAAEECLVLEDSYNGITAAHRAGIRVVMIPDLLPPTSEIEKLFFRKADVLTDVIPIIELFNSRALIP